MSWASENPKVSKGSQEIIISEPTQIPPTEVGGLIIPAGSQGQAKDILFSQDDNDGDRQYDGVLCNSS